MSTTARPLTIGITMGDPAGIGPEIIVKALADPDIRRLARFVVFGVNELMVYAADLAELEPDWLRVPFEDLHIMPGTLAGAHFERDLVVADVDLPETFDKPVPSSASGRASMQFCRLAIDAAKLGQLDAIVTAPISKHAWTLAGYKYPGHTELFGHLFGSRHVGMAFIAGALRVALASIHVGLFELRHQFTIGSVFTPIDLLHQTLRDGFGIAQPHIAVCGLNPHAGEQGQFGDEEARIITPAIDMARHAGIDARGPLPADTLFWHAANGRYDGVVAMYHDQGLIPVKMTAFDTAVNLTMGLPIVRTSPDHGTAYDIAGRNKANPGSFKHAIKLAAFLASSRRRTPPAV